MYQSEEEIRALIKQIGAGEYKDGSSLTAGTLYHGIPYAEFNDIPCHKHLKEERDYVFNDIASLPFRKKRLRVLDIGAANGLYTFPLADKGHNVIAYEGDSAVHAVNQAIAEWRMLPLAPGHEFKLRNEYFTDETASKLKGKYDVVFMLNVHAWIHKQIGDERTKEMLKTLSHKVRWLYFQTMHAESGGMHVVHSLKNKADIEAYLTECGFTPEHLRDTGEHGGLRVLYRCRGAK